MTPQSTFMIVAPVAKSRMGELRRELFSMNRAPGVADPQNQLVPFGQFEGLHFARFVILDDQTLDDITVAYHMPRVDYPVYLAFLGDFDGPADEFFRQLLQRAGPGLQRIFSHCEDFTRGCNLLSWMKAHERRAQTIYWNWLGRTVRQIREEDSLFVALGTFLESNNPSLTKMPAREVHASLVKFVRGEQETGRLVLTPPEPTPLAWQLRNLWDLIWVPLVLLILSPVFLAYAPFFIFQLRSRERSDLVLTPRPDPDHVKKLVEIEDHGVTNQFTAFGSIKPGMFRHWSFRYYLWIIDYTTRHFYNRARPVYVNTIHFARVVLFDDGRRLFFASSYDGSLDSYLDDFINKISFGLNILFTQGIGYPRTSWIFLGGAKQEQEFKYYVRRHEMATEVWYNAHPGLTCVDLQRNSLIRAGLENKTMTDAEITKWLQLF